jgi:hypothetical protein
MNAGAASSHLAQQARRLYADQLIAALPALSTAVLETARALDPLSGFITRFLAFAHLLRGDVTRAMMLYRSAAPLGSPFATVWDAELYRQAAAVDEGLAELGRLSPDRAADPYILVNKALLLAAKGDRDQPQRMAAEFEQGMASNPALGNFAARIRISLGDYDRGLDLLKAVVDANAMAIFYKDQPLWSPIRRDERFQALLRRMRIPAD